MLKVLAAEISDPGRLLRGKRLRADDAVVDLVIGHGAATAVVQGSRPDPYVVTLLTRAGRSVPTRRDLTVRCTCPDDDALGGGACKHAVAALFALADEVSLDLDVLARWRQSETFAASHPESGDRDNEVHDEPPAPVDPLIAELTDLLRTTPRGSTPGPAGADGARHRGHPRPSRSPMSSTTRSLTCGCAGTDAPFVRGPRPQQYFGR